MRGRYDLPMLSVRFANNLWQSYAPGQIRGKALRQKASTIPGYPYRLHATLCGNSAASI
jgi:hypothetical protein